MRVDSEGTPSGRPSSGSDRLEELRRQLAEAEATLAVLEAEVARRKVRLVPAPARGGALPVVEDVVVRLATTKASKVVEAAHTEAEAIRRLAAAIRNGGSVIDLRDGFSCEHPQAQERLLADPRVATR